MPGKLLLLRHVHTPFNTGATGSEKFRGWLDVPVDEEGMKQSKELAAAIKPLNVIYIVSSDFKRAKVPADAIGTATGARVILSRYLRPWNLGTFAGKEVGKFLPILLKYQRETPDKAPPGGEPYQSFHARWCKGLDTLLKATDLAKDNELIVAVTHVRNLLATPNILTGGKESIDPKEGPHTATGYLMEKKDGGWSMSEWSGDNLAGGSSEAKGRMSAKEARYEELDGAKKDADCSKVYVSGGVSKELGCCAEWERKGSPKQFRCGTCEYLM